MCHRCDNARRITETLQGATEVELYGNTGIDPKEYFKHHLDAWSRRQAQEVADAVDQTLYDQVRSMTQQEWDTLGEFGTWPERFKHELQS